MNEWNIQSRSHACQACGQSFADQQHYHTLLIDLRHEIQRRDLCEPCWKREESEGANDRKGFISHWQGVYEVPPAAPDPIQKENAESLLRKIMELNDAKYAAASYILAVMLERKRVLKVKEQLQRDGQRIFVYEQPKSGDVFTIPDPNLQLNQLDAVQRDVAALLEHGLVSPTEVQTAPASDTSESQQASSSEQASAGETAPGSGEDFASAPFPPFSPAPASLEVRDEKCEVGAEHTSHLAPRTSHLQ